MPTTREWFDTVRTQVARAGVAFALFLGLQGSIITFYPGAEVGWFSVAATAALAGLVSPTRRLRVIAVVLAVTFAGFAWGGHVRGRQYCEWLKLQPGVLGL